MFFKLINSLKTKYISNNNKFIIKKTKKNKNLINLLIKFNIIKFVIEKNKKFIVILNFLKNNKIIFKLNNLYKPSKIKIIKYKNLKKINKKNSIIIISSNKGIIDNFTARKKKLGGIIILQL